MAHKKNIANPPRQSGPILGVFPPFGGDTTNHQDKGKNQSPTGVVGHVCTGPDFPVWEVPVWEVPDFDFPVWEVPDWEVPDYEFPEWEVPDFGNDNWGPLPADDWGPLPNEDWGPLPAGDWEPVDGSARNQATPRHLKQFRPFLP